MVLCSIKATGLSAQHVNQSRLPPAVKAAFTTKYAEAVKVTWKIENGNYEANWGGKSGEDSSAKFTPAGQFVEIVTAIPITSLPAQVAGYVKTHYKNARITVAGKGIDASGGIFYEAEVEGKDLMFDLNGNLIKEEK
jgi:hypothetical protein